MIKSQSELTRLQPKIRRGSLANRNFSLTPAMGYNTWNAIHTNIDENLVVRIAERMVETGLAAVGYRYVNIDDGWEVDRGPNGTLTADPARFPSGLRAISDKVHSLGLLFGVSYIVDIKSSCNNLTFCAGIYCYARIHLSAAPR